MVVDCMLCEKIDRRFLIDVSIAKVRIIHYSCAAQLFVSTCIFHSFGANTSSSFKRQKIFILIFMKNRHLQY